MILPVSWKRAALGFYKRHTAEGPLFRIKNILLFGIFLAVNVRPLLRCLLRRPVTRNPGGNLVGILSMYRPIFWHGPIFEMHVYRWLEARGYAPVFLVCRGLADVCDSQFFQANSSNNPLLCVDCRARHDAYFQGNGVRVQVLDSYCDPAGIAADIERIDRIRSVEEASVYRYKGLPLGEIARLNVCRYFLRLSLDDRHVEVYKRHLRAGVKLYSAFSRFLDTHRCENFLIFNGRYLMHAVPLALIRQANLPFTTYEMGDKESFLICHDDVSVMWSDVAEGYKRWRANEDLSQRERVELEEFTRQRQRHYVATFSSLARLDIHDTWDVLCCTNVVWDSGVYGRDTIFRDQFEWVCELISYCASHGLRLVVRVHPAEINVIYNKTCERMLDVIRAAYPVLPEGVRVIAPEEPVSTYELIERVRVVTVYSSSVGLESVMRGKPVVLAGWAHYRDRGFTVDPDSKAAYFNAVASMTEATAMPTADVAEATRYAYWYYLRYNKLNHTQLFSRPFHTPEDSLLLRAPMIERASESAELTEIMNGLLDSGHRLQATKAVANLSKDARGG